MDFINTWQFNLILYYVFNVIFYQSYKVAVRDVKNDGSATLILQAVAAFSQLLVVPFFVWQLPNSLKIVGLMLLASVFYAVNDRLQTTVRKNLEVSAFSILSQLSTVFLLIYGFTIFREGITWQKLAGATLIIAANSWLLYKREHKKFDINKYYVIGALALLSFATAISIDIGISDKFNLPFYIFITLMIPAAMITLAEKIKLKTVYGEWQNSNKRDFLICGIAWGFTILFSLRAFQFGEVSVIVPLQAVPVLLNVLVAFFFMGERGSPVKKVLAAILVVLGVYLTVM